MGGMFALVKIREGLAVNDYNDPGSYKHPEGTVAYEFKEGLAEAPQQGGQAEMKMPGMEMQAVKPGTTTRHTEHH